MNEVMPGVRNARAKDFIRAIATTTRPVFRKEEMV